MNCCLLDLKRASQTSRTLSGFVSSTPTLGPISNPVVIHTKTALPISYLVGTSPCKPVVAHTIWAIVLHICSTWINTF